MSTLNGICWQAGRHASRPSHGNQAGGRSDAETDGAVDVDLAERLKGRVEKAWRTVQTVVTPAIERYLRTPLKGRSR